MKYVAVYVSV